MPAALPTAFEKPERLILSGRIVGSDGKALAGATVAVGRDQTATDADGRFALVTAMRPSHRTMWRVTWKRRTAKSFVMNSRRDGEGAWRASFSLTFA